MKVRSWIRIYGWTRWIFERDCSSMAKLMNSSRVESTGWKQARQGQRRGWKADVDLLKSFPSTLRLLLLTMLLVSVLQRSINSDHVGRSWSLGLRWWVEGKGTKGRMGWLTIKDIFSPNLDQVYKYRPPKRTVSINRPTINSQTNVLDIILDHNQLTPSPQYVRSNTLRC